MSPPKPRFSPAKDKPRRKPKYVVVLGEKYGMLTVIGPVTTNGSMRYVLVRCECGVEMSHSVTKLFSVPSPNCGCSRGSFKNLTLNGETHNVSQWAAKLGISGTALAMRLDAGWSLERALTVTKKVPCVG